VRRDLRGTGESDGVLTDEYTEQEQEDALEVLAWLRAQPWCDGRLGMWGISWGGFNSLQIAARRPPGLGAIVTLCSTDDRYAGGPSPRAAPGSDPVVSAGDASSLAVARRRNPLSARNRPVSSTG
jgi:putative CocE/NonD family hydrolase